MSTSPLSGKVAFVTGAAGGIGRAICLALGRAGSAVAAVDFDKARLAETLEELQRANVRAATFETDLAVEEQLDRAVTTATEALGPVDILVNAAGVVGRTRALLTTDGADWDRVYAINVRAPFLLMRAICPSMVQRGGGRIINITSGAAHRANSPPAYSSSKSALMQLTRSVAAEFGRHGINVNAVSPGLTRTPMVVNAFGAEGMDALVNEGAMANLLGRMSEPEDIAEGVLFLASPASRQITAQTLHVGAGSIVSG